MKYIDKNGNIVVKKDKVNEILKWMYSNRFGIYLMRIISNKVFSLCIGSILNCKISKILIKPFVKGNNIDMTQYEEKSYGSYNEFFIRKIKKEYREFSKNEYELCSPSDGKISVYDIDGQLFNIKSHDYTLEELLNNKYLSEKYVGGKIAIIRLSVDNYHRYSFIDSGEVSNYRRINGRYYSVDPISLKNQKVFKENTREFCLIKSENFGTFIQMEVGATCVGRIVNHSIKKAEKGIEKGYFEFGGSTILLIFQKNKIEFLDKYYNSKYEHEIFMGDVIGYATRKKV